MRRASRTGSAAHRVSFVTGLAEDGFEAVYTSYASAAGSGMTTAIGFDAVNARSGINGLHPANMATASNARFSNTALGFHFVAGLDVTLGAAGTFFGDAGNPTWIQTGLSFALRM